MTIAISGTNGITLDGQFNSASSMGFKNRLINGAFSVAQRGTSFTSTSSANNDDTYNLDRWYVLSDGNDIVDITQNTAASATGDKYNIALDVETVNKKFGIAQIIENINCYDLQDQSVTLSFKAKVSSTTKLDNIKCAIVAWSGTADTVTSDIISAWNAEGTDPTLIANATYENTPANLNVTTSWVSYSVTATVDTSSTGNVIVFIWSDVTDTTLGDFLYITGVQLEVGSTATSFDYRPYGTELALCYRYYQTNPQTMAVALSSGALLFQAWFSLPMRATPSLTLTTTTPYIENNPWATVSTTSGFTVTNGHMSVLGGDVRCDGTMSGVAANQNILFGGSQVRFSAEL
jgi:hypothetical protein